MCKQAERYRTEVSKRKKCIPWCNVVDCCNFSGYNFIFSFFFILSLLSLSLSVSFFYTLLFGVVPFLIIRHCYFIFNTFFSLLLHSTLSYTFATIKKCFSSDLLLYKSCFLWFYLYYLNVLFYYIIIFI